MSHRGSRAHLLQHSDNKKLSTNQGGFVVLRTRPGAPARESRDSGHRAGHLVVILYPLHSSKLGLVGSNWRGCPQTYHRVLPTNRGRSVCVVILYECERRVILTLPATQRTGRWCWERCAGAQHVQRKRETRCVEHQPREQSIIKSLPTLAINHYVLATRPIPRSRPEVTAVGVLKCDQTFARLAATEYTHKDRRN